jgi:hypothetical protein
MKTTIKLLAIIAGTSLIMASCSKSDTTTATVYYQQQDQMGRPAINTVFINAAAKDSFNTTPPSAMAGLFGAKMKTQLLALNPLYTTNALTLTADQFTGLLDKDVLGVTTSNTTPTTFFDGTNVLTGRALGDDVIDVELTLIFGGPHALDAVPSYTYPNLVSDHVNGNDKAFNPSFPYLASPW